MDISSIFTPQALAQGGLGMVAIYLCVKAIIQLYGDMRNDRKTVDEGITTALKTVSSVLDGVVKNLDNLTTKVDKLTDRICYIEKEIGEGENVGKRASVNS